MNRDVDIEFKSKMVDIDDGVILRVKGESFYRNGKHYVRYIEKTDSGSEIINVLKYNTDGLEVTKSGGAKMKMVYRQGEKYATVYNTEMGSMLLSMDTKAFDFSRTEDRHDLYVKYNMDINDEPVSECEISINIKSV